MDATLKESLWNQFGASLDMLDNAISMCPEEQWAQFDFWYLAYHTLFWTDLYLFGSVDGFKPPAPYTLGELDPEGVFPDRTYSKDEMRSYLAHCRGTCQEIVDSLTVEHCQQHCAFNWGEASYLELMMYNMRHVQHGAAQLNLRLRQSIDSAPRWVAKAKG